MGTIKSIRLGCAAIVRKGDLVLMGVRGKDPNKGMWILPGGGVNFGESLEDTVIREIQEEAGIRISVDNVASIEELINPPDEHRVIVYFDAQYIDGEIEASSDLEQAQFLDSSDLKELSRKRQISPIVEKVLNEQGLI